MAIELSNVAIAVIHLFVALVLSFFAVYLGIAMFTSKTRAIDTWAELRKKNTAIGIMLASVVLAVALVIQPSIALSLGMFNEKLTLTALIVRFTVAVLNVAIAALLALAANYFSFLLIDKLTAEIEELDEIKKGNAGVAIYMGAIMIAVAFIVSSSVETIIAAIDIFSYAKQLGF
jgi:uncharacterized membrane protein YjfL (UPF0719 family)